MQNKLINNHINNKRQQKRHINKTQNSNNKNHIQETNITYPCPQEWHLCLFLVLALVVFVLYIQVEWLLPDIARSLQASFMVKRYLRIPNPCPRHSNPCPEVQVHTQVINIYLVAFQYGTRDTYFATVHVGTTTLWRY